jgi:hypothetical protein
LNNGEKVIKVVMGLRERAYTTDLGETSASAPVTARRRRRTLYAVLVRVMLVVAVLLALYNAALLLYQRLDAPPAPGPGALLYITTFDAFNEQWAQYDGQMNARITDGQLLVTIGAAGDGAYSDLSRTFNDFEAQVEATWLTETEFDQIAFLFRLSDADNYYAFKLRADGAYRVERKFGPGAQDVETLSEWQFAPEAQLGRGAKNTLGVLARGGSFRFFINGVQLPLCPKGDDRRSTWRGLQSGQCMSNGGRVAPALEDGGLGQGKLALGAVAEAPGLQVAFDNLLVRGPGGLN